MTSRLLMLCSAALLLLTACSRPVQITVGSKDTVEGNILSEIVAQHIEHKLGRPVQRQFNLGDTKIVHQSLIGGTISLYPEYSGLLEAEILREQPSTDPSVVFERVRLEMKRVSLLEYIVPLGFDSRTALVIAAAGNEKITTATEAAMSGRRWKPGVTFEFQNRESGLAALKDYKLELGAPMRALKPGDLFKQMDEGTVDLAVATTSDGHLTLPKWKALKDDQDKFIAGQAALLVRDDVLEAEPTLRKILEALGGTISLETMQKMNAQVEVEERKVAEVASEFLQSSGLN